MLLNTLVFLEQKADLGATMSKAGLNTLMGLLVVFFTLAFIACVIALEGKIFTAIAKKKPAPRTVESDAGDASAAVEPEASGEADDGELVAVIAAAIAAFEAENGSDIPADALVVRSIRRLR